MPSLLTIAREFWTELKTPYDVFICLLTRFLADKPQVIAHFQRTDWLRSATGFCHFWSAVWFYGNRFHGVVCLHRGTKPSMHTAQIIWRTQHTNWRDAYRAARKQAAMLVTLKTVF